MSRYRLAESYSQAIVRERIAWTMWLATDRAHPDFQHVAGRWRQAAEELARSASLLATADTTPGHATRERQQRRPGRLALTVRSRLPEPV